MKAIKVDWAYTQIAYLLDVEEVVWPMVEAVRAAGINDTTDLRLAVLCGEPKTWGKRYTKRGMKGLMKVLYNHCKVDQTTLVSAWYKFYK